MSYRGNTASIPLGRGGLHTDDPQLIIPQTNLISAKNIGFSLGLVEKETGSRRWNATTKLPGPVKAFFDWWPSEGIQRMVAMCGDGKVYRFTDRYTYSEVTATGPSPVSLQLQIADQAVMASGGCESVNRNRKLFMFTGNDPIQVLSGDGTTRSNIAIPAADWTAGSYPKFGIIHRGSLFAFGNKNAPHTLYRSNPANHEDFVTDIFIDNVYPGDAEGLLSGFIYKGKLFLFKFPKGLYILNDTDPDFTNWRVNKISDSFGAASFFPGIQVLDDAIVANSTGSITSLKATQNLGDVTSGDVLSLLRNESYMREVADQSGFRSRYAYYYEDKKRALFTYKGKTALSNNLILNLDYYQQVTPVVEWTDKDQANMITGVKDIFGVQRPYYGTEEGYLYEMDVPDRVVEGLPAPLDIGGPSLFTSPGNLSNGKHKYVFTYFDATRETDRSPVGFLTSGGGTFLDANVNTGTDTITVNNHGLPNGATVRLLTTGVLPAGLSTNTDYFIINRTNNTFKLSLTSGGPAIDITAAAGGGTHTVQTQILFEFEIFDNTVAGQALLGLPIDPTNTATGRKIYRKAPGSSDFKLVATVNDNTTATYTDNIADASLGAVVPEINGFHYAYRLEFQTPYMDFAQADVAQSEMNKRFEFLELTYEPTGRWDLSIDVFIDGVFIETITFQTSHGPVLGDFTLDTERLSGRIPRSIRKPLHGIGRRISLKCYNSGYKQNCRNAKLTIYSNASADQQNKQEP